MKQSVQQIKRKQTSAVNNKQPSVTRLRPRVVSQSNHTRQGSDKWERQADDAAARIMRGEKGIARMLTPTAAANVTVPSSRGEPLPQSLREELERGFGADLSAVRIHRDAAADAATTAHHAKAFTSGPNIYFSHGKFESTDDASRDLLTHEVAHVLQQTGRRGSEGQLKATDVSGTGDIQKLVWESPVSDVAAPSIEDVFKKHELQWGRDDKIEIEQLKSAFYRSPDKDKFWEIRAGFTDGKKKDPVFNANHMELHPGELACLYDSLKAAGKLEGAAKLLRAHPEVETLFFSADLYVQYVQSFGVDHLLDQIYRIWSTAPFFGRATPQNILDRTLIYLLGPTRARSHQEIRGGKRLVDLAMPELKKRLWPSNPIQNELYFVTVYIAYEIEILRFELLREIAGKVGEGRAETIDVKLAAAFQVKRDASNIQKFGVNSKLVKVFSRESLRIFERDFAPALVNIADLAIAFWTTARKAYLITTRPTRKGKDVAGLGKTAEKLIRNIEKHTDIIDFSGLPHAVQTLGKKIFARNSDGTLPAPGTYDRRRRSARNEFVVHVYENYERPFANLFKQSFTPPKEKKHSFFFAEDAARSVERPLMVLTAWTLAIAPEIVAAADDYKVEEDKERVKKYPKDSNADFREAHRVRCARTLLKFADIADWGSVIDLAKPVATAQEQVTQKQMQKQNVLALLQDWKLDKIAPIERLKQDEGSGRVRGWEPLSVGEIVDFYLAEDYSQTADKLNDLLKNEKGKYDRRLDPLLDRGVAEAKKLERPRRYVVRKVVFAAPRDKLGHVKPLKDRYIIQELIRKHPATKALMAREEKRLNYFPSYIIPTKQGEHTGIAIWLLPWPIALVERFQEIEEFNRILAREQLKVEKVATPPGTGNSKDTKSKSREPNPDEIAARVWKIALLPVEVWWDQLQAVLSTVGASLFRDAMKRSGFALDLEMERKLQLLHLQETIRDANTHERRRVVNTQLRPLLNAYEPGANVWETFRLKGEKTGVTVRDIPKEVLDRLTRLLVQIPAQAERDAHFAVALIELSDLIEIKLGNTKKGRVLFDWLPALNLALDRIEDKSTRLAPLTQYLPVEDRSKKGLIEIGRKRLDKVLRKLEDAVENMQLEFGITGTPGNTIENPGFIKARKSGREIGRDQVFTIDGRSWQILQVKKEFLFHPPAWPRRHREKPDRTGGSLLRLPGEGDKDKEYRTEDHPGKIELLYVLIDEGPEVTIIHENDRALLTELAWSTMQYSTIAQLKDLAEGIEFAGRFALDVAELFPVVGPAVAASRLVITVMSFLSGELDDLLNELIKNPEELIQRMGSSITKALEPENLVEYLLFGNVAFEGLRNKKRKGARSFRGSKSGRLRRLLLKLQTIGLGVATTFGKVQRGVRDKREASQLLVMRSPVAVHVISLLAENFRLLAEIPDMAEEVLDFKEQAKGFANSLGETLDAMGSIEIPEDILPMEEIVSVVLDVVGHRLGGKYKAGVRILIGLLKFVGAWDEVVRAIAAGIEKTGVSKKNILPIWKENLVLKIEKAMRSAQKQIHGRLSETFDTVGITLPTPKTKIGYTKDNEFPEAQPFVDTGRDPVAASFPDLSGGRPLEPRVQADMESRFGHRFEHVRLHTGPTVEHFNRSAGTRAVTSGSHILLGHSAGDSVLRHELAHVIQQTGPRPLGLPHDPRPRMGSPHGGLKIDPSAEANAESAAHQAMEDSASRPIRVGGGKTVGLQPSLIDDIGHRFLRYLVGFEEIEADVAAIDRSGHGTGIRLIGRDVRKAVSKVADKLDAVFRQPRKLKIHRSVKDTFKPKRDEIAGHLHNQKKKIAGAIEDIAIQASFVAVRGRGRKAPTMALDIHKFENKLTRYIFGKTGVLLDIELDKKGVGEKAILKQADPIQSVTLRFVHLPPISSNSKLWKYALTHRPLAIPGQKPTPIPEKDRGPLRARIRQVLRDMGPSKKVWDHNRYMLSHKVFEREEELAKQKQEAVSAGKLPADKLPPKKEYLAEKWAKPLASPEYDHIGLRLGTYADRKKNGERSQRGKERESHHITQYLLAEYFHHGEGTTLETNPKRVPFKLLKDHPDAYPKALDVESGSPQRFVPSTNKTIDIADTEKRHGNAMPTILLARTTHRMTPSIHVTPKADDLGQDVATQAGVVNRQFEGYLSDTYKLKEKAGLENYKTWTDWRDANISDANQTIYSAMQETYQWMAKLMQKRLKTALTTREREYYNDLADQTGHGKEVITKSEMEEVYTKAVKHEKRGMDKFGWKR